MRRPLIAGNWKMCLTPSLGEAMVRELLPLIRKSRAEALLCVPATHLQACREAALGSDLRIGAENMHWEAEGAYTGEISAVMLLDLGVRYVIIGHSERRTMFGERDEIVCRKAAAAAGAGLVPIICLGESLEERESGKTFDLLCGQLEGSLAFWDGRAEIVLAYEPLWAIGTGLSATPADAEEVCGYLRTFLREKYGEEAAEKTRILYGGSVKPATIGGLMAEADIDGALVGGASLKAASFGEIVNYDK